jgi:YD repeat-containing protein
MFRFKFSFLTLVLNCAAIFIGSTVSAQDPNSGDNSMSLNKSATPSGNSGMLPSGAPSITTDLYTGKLTASIPLFVLESSDLKIPISLNYMAGGGVRPSDPNTEVGMDWSLMAGGRISRVVKGIPDESDQGYIGLNTQHIHGTVNQGVNVVNSYDAGQIYLFNNHANGRAPLGPLDGEPDVFYIQTPLFNAQFTIDENGNVVFQNKTGLAVKHQLYKNSGAPGTGITMTDDQGNVYIFGNNLQAREMTTTKFFGAEFTYTSTWYLEQIILFNSKDVVNFTYVLKSDFSVINYMNSKKFTYTYPSGTSWPPTVAPISSSNVASMPAQIGTTTYFHPKFISQITTKLGEVDFNYTDNPNTNISAGNPPALTSINIKQFNPQTNSNSTLLKTITLSYTDILTGVTGYTQPYPFPDIYSDYYRRLLTGVAISGNAATTLNLYTLKYYQLLPYPDRGVPQNCDYWGFPNSTAFNPDASNADGGFFTNPDNYREPTVWNPPSDPNTEVPSAAIFAIQELDDVNGGATKINYELNTYYNGSSNVTVGGTRVNSIVKSIPGGQSFTTNYQYNDAAGHSTGQIWTDFYKRVSLSFGVSCCNYSTVSYSLSPYNIADANGVFVGYSAVKTVYPNGGFEIDSFTNFTEYPDDISSTPSFFQNNWSDTYNSYVQFKMSDFSYRRGLPKSRAIYTSNGTIISQVTNTFGSLDGPTRSAMAIQDGTWVFDNNTYEEAMNLYHSNVENWRLLQTTRKDYDQLNPNNFIQATSNYTYNDKRLVSSITSTDSKGHSHIQTFYYPGDNTSIPMINSSELAAVQALTAANRTNVIVHQVDNRNGIIHQTHHSYGTISTGLGSSIFVLSDATYAGSTLQSQINYSYDPSNAQLIASTVTGDKATAVLYGYNNCYPVAKVINGSASSTYTTSQSTLTASIPSVPGFVNFTSDYQGTILVREVGTGITVNFTLEGPTPASSNLCSGSGCGTPSPYPVNNALPGSYKLTATPVSGSGAIVVCDYPAISTSHTFTAEFFFEGFEENSAAVAGNSHSGSKYYNGNFTVPFTMPNSRKYLIQWWNLSNGKWIFNQQSYANGMALSGPVDDVRVFPSDALMSTYTYSPLLGRTSETDPSGRMTTFEYDDLGRLLRARDQDGNILKQMDYKFQVGLQQ